MERGSGCPGPDPIGEKNRPRRRRAADTGLIVEGFNGFCGKILIVVISLIMGGFHPYCGWF